MKIYSLIFDYNITKMKETGRPWAETSYKNSDFIFTYSAASIATFLHHNPHLKYEILTDNVNLLSQKISSYNVDTRNLEIVDAKVMIEKWASHWYCFWPLIASFDHQLENSREGVLKLDNDLTCLKPIDELLRYDGAIVWKRERNCKDGREYWGEKYAAYHAFGINDFEIYNTGTWGLSKRFFSNLRSGSLTEPSSFCHSDHALGTNCKRYLVLRPGDGSDGIDIHLDGLGPLAHPLQHGSTQLLVGQRL